MAKELLLYDPIFSFTAERFIEDLETFKDEDVTARINSPGGGVFNAYGMFAKMREHGNVSIKLDGLAASGAGFMLMYAKDVEALSVSRVMLHRAASFDDSEETQRLVSEVNDDLREQMESRVNANKFEQVTGTSIQELFEAERRIDVWLTADQAKEVGLVNKVTNLTTQDAEGVAASGFARIYASLNDPAPAPTAAPQPQQKISKPNKKESSMDLNKFKAEHPEIFAQAVEAGVNQERERVGAWMSYVDVDAEAVTKGIDEGKNLTPKVMAELSRKQFSKESLTAMEGDNAQNVQTQAPAEGGKGKGDGEDKVEAGTNAVLAQLGISNAKKS